MSFPPGFPPSGVSCARCQIRVTDRTTLVREPVNFGPGCLLPTEARAMLFCGAACRDQHVEQMRTCDIFGRELKTAGRYARGRCGVCAASPAELKTCVECHLVDYCGKRCQTEAWPEHKKNCKMAKKLFKQLRSGLPLIDFEELFRMGIEEHSARALNLSLVFALTMMNMAAKNETHLAFDVVAMFGCVVVLVLLVQDHVQEAYDFIRFWYNRPWLAGNPKRHAPGTTREMKAGNVWSSVNENFARYEKGRFVQGTLWSVRASDYAGDSIKDIVAKVAVDFARSSPPGTPAPDVRYDVAEPFVTETRRVEREGRPVIGADEICAETHLAKFPELAACFALVKFRAAGDLKRGAGTPLAVERCREQEEVAEKYLRKSIEYLGDGCVEARRMLNVYAWSVASSSPAGAAGPPHGRPPRPTSSPAGDNPLGGTIALAIQHLKPVTAIEAALKKTVDDAQSKMEAAGGGGGDGDTDDGGDAEVAEASEKMTKIYVHKGD